MFSLARSSKKLKGHLFGVTFRKKLLFYFTYHNITCYVESVTYYLTSVSTYTTVTVQTAVCRLMTLI